MLQVIVITKEMTQNIYSYFLFAMLQNIEHYGMSVLVDIMNFHNPAVNILMLIMSTTIIYRLIRMKTLLLIRSILNK